MVLQVTETRHSGPCGGPTVTLPGRDGGAVPAQSGGWQGSRSGGWRAV